MGTAKSSRPPKLAFLIMPNIFTIQTWTNQILKYNKFFLWNTPHQIVGWITVCFRIAFLYKYMYIYMYIYIYISCRWNLPILGEFPSWDPKRENVSSTLRFQWGPGPPNRVDLVVSSTCPKLPIGRIMSATCGGWTGQIGWGIGRGILWNGCDFYHFDSFCIFFFENAIWMFYVQVVWLCIFPFKDTIKCHLSIYGGFKSLDHFIVLTTMVFRIPS
jgi:hypothetical protein